MKPLAPPATIGIIGGGQLGNMILREAHRMGYRVFVTDPSPESPAGARADGFIPAAFDDADALERIAEASDVVTLEIEHVPYPGLERISDRVPVRPRAEIFQIIQDRAEQRAFIAKNGFPQPENARVDQESDLKNAVDSVGTPAILKTRRGGYDGRGQGRIQSGGDAEEAWKQVGSAPAVLEAFIPFEKEISVVLARGLDGETRSYPAGENVHKNGILHTTRVPARIDDALAQQAQDLTRQIAEALDHVGVITVEYFVTQAGGLLINEIAPRIHNSGHYTEAASPTPQGEQHLRAICGMPLGPTTPHHGVAMVNILGDAWQNGPPDWTPILEHPGARLHLYGKAAARPGRKMGHFTVIDEDVQQAHQDALRIYERLMGRIHEPSVPQNAP